jgi:hypothetical protein
MKSMCRTAACVAALCLISAAARAADGVQIAERTTVDGTPQTNRVLIAKDLMRAEIADPASGAKQTIIFDGTRQVIDIVNMDRKTYVEVTKAQLDQLGAQMHDMMGQMQAAMASMPPAQRAQMEAMMRGRGVGPLMSSGVKTEYRKSGTDHVGQWTCDTYEGSQNGQKVSEVCTVDPATIGLGAAEVATVQQLAAFFNKLIPEGAGMMDIGRPEAQGFSGLPIRTSTTLRGKTVTNEITGVSRQALDDSLFQVPAGFQKQDFPGGMGR